MGDARPQHRACPFASSAIKKWTSFGWWKAITKYAALVSDPSSIRYHLERAIHLATHGRPGPVWLDVPINVQAARIEPDSLGAYDPEEDRLAFDTPDLNAVTHDVLERLRSSERPVIYAGSGIRLSGEYDRFLKLAR